MSDNINKKFFEGDIKPDFEEVSSIIQKPKNILDIIIHDDNRFKIFNKYRAIRIKKYECNFSKHKLMVKKRPNTHKKNFRTLQ
jgi:hypothetical protein